MNDELIKIRGWLAFNIGQWRSFAKHANVPYSTLEKVARGTTKNPRYETFDKIRAEYLRRTGQSDDHDYVEKQ